MSFKVDSLWLFILSLLGLAAYAAFILGVLYGGCYIVKHFFFT